MLDGKLGLIELIIGHIIVRTGTIILWPYIVTTQTHTPKWTLLSRMFVVFLLFYILSFSFKLLLLHWCKKSSCSCAVFFYFMSIWALLRAVLLFVFETIQMKIEIKIKTKQKNEKENNPKWEGNLFVFPTCFYFCVFSLL